MYPHFPSYDFMFFIFQGEFGTSNFASPIGMFLRAWHARALDKVLQDGFARHADKIFVRSLTPADLTKSRNLPEKGRNL